MSAIFPVNSEGCEWDTILETSTHKRHLFYRRSRRQNKIEFFRRVTITHNPLHFVSNRQKNVKKRHVLTFFGPFLVSHPLRKTMYEITLFAYKAAN